MGSNDSRNTQRNAHARAIQHAKKIPYTEALRLADQIHATKADETPASITEIRELDAVNLLDPRAAHTAVYGSHGSGYTILARQLIQRVAHACRVVLISNLTEDQDIAREAADTHFSIREGISPARLWWQEFSVDRESRIWAGDDNQPPVLIVVNVSHTDDMSTLGLGLSVPKEVIALAATIGQAGRALRAHMLFVGPQPPPESVSKNISTTLILRTVKTQHKQVELRHGKSIAHAVSSLSHSNAVLIQQDRPAALVKFATS